MSKNRWSCGDVIPLVSIWQMALQNYWSPHRNPKYLRKCRKLGDSSWNHVIALGSSLYRFAWFRNMSKKRWSYGHVIPLVSTCSEYLLERSYVETCYGNHENEEWYSELPKAITWFHDESPSFLHFRSYFGLRWGDHLFWSAMQLASSMWCVEEKIRCGLHNTGKSYCSLALWSTQQGDPCCHTITL